MKVKRSHLLPTSRYDANELPEKKNLPAVSREQEHEWRELLQKQLADHWLELIIPKRLTEKCDLRENPWFRRESRLRE